MHWKDYYAVFFCNTTDSIALTNGTLSNGMGTTQVLRRALFNFCYDQRPTIEKVKYRRGAAL